MRCPTPRRRQLLLSACCLASVLLATSSGASSPHVVQNRFGRSLLSYESTTPSYLLPTQLPQLCQGSNCCQEDDYTSAYQVMMLNSTYAQYGGRSYTTFFMNLQRSFTCDTDVDTMGCCNANVSTVWIDIDPELKVVYTTLNAQRWTSSVQDSNGFRLNISPQQFLALSPSTLMSVTVSGAVDQLCPIPDIAPVPGYCSVILEGGIPGNPNACCPRGVSRPSSISNWVPPISFTCIADPAVSPFVLTQASVSNVYIGADGTEYVDYVLNLGQYLTCREGPNSCCGMHLSNLEIKVLASAQITGVTINTASYGYTSSDWNDLDAEPGMYKVVSLEGLDWPVEEVPRSGNILTVTVKIPAGSSAVPQLCAPEGDVPGTYGACSYYLYSANGFCCPSGATNTVTGPIMPNSCNPTTAVAAADASFAFMYYEWLSSASATEFIFVVNSNGAADCGKPYCVDVCGWELAVNDAFIPQLTYSSDLEANTARSLVQRGPNAALIFAFSSGAATSQYIIKTPVGSVLEQLCRANAHPDQGSYPCAATVRSGSVYSMVFFSENDLVIKVYPDICPVSQPLADSCLRPGTTRYNSPDTQSTVFDFELVRMDPTNGAGAGCQAAADLSFEVILSPGPVGSLVNSNDVNPSDGVDLNMTSGVEWMSTPSAANSAKRYSFRLDGVRDVSQVCIQNLPDQPKDTCMVQFKSADKCFSGFVAPVRDTSLIWTPDYGKGKPPASAAVIVPAVVVPVVALLAVALAALFFVRRRRAAAYAPAGEGSMLDNGEEDDLNAPLTGGRITSGTVEPSEASVASAAAVSLSEASIAR